MDKLILISRLKGCNDTHNHIKSFLFFDQVQSDARYYKHFANFTISDSIFNNERFWDELWDDAKIQVVWFFMNRNICMEGKFCLKCGNYQYATTCIQSCVCTC